MNDSGIDGKMAAPDERLIGQSGEGQMKIDRETVKSPTRAVWILVCAGAFFGVLGAKLWLIGFASNPTPFWDEWDAGAAFLFKPYIEGHLSIADLFRTHNEHLVVFTRLFMLTILKISGYWDVVLQMIVNASIQAGEIALIAAGFSRVLDAPRVIVAMLASSLIFILPYGWESTLLGFNTHFYLLIAFSFGGLACFYAGAAWSGRWWLGLLLALGSFLNMAGGALTLVSICGLILLQLLCKRRSGAPEWLAFLFLSALTLALIAEVPRLPGHEPLRAHSLQQFISAFVLACSWPLPSPLGVLLYAPTVLFAVRTIRQAPPLSDPRWFNLAAFIWILVQIGAIALGRVQSPLSSRYLDILTLGVVLNVVNALYLTRKSFNFERSQRWLAACLMLAFSIFVFSFKDRQPGPFHLNQVRERRDTAATEEINVRGYLATKDLSFLTKKPQLDIPYPSAERLRTLLDDPAIRSILPPILIGQAPALGQIEEIKTNVLRYWYIAICLAVVLFQVAAMGTPSSRPTRPEHEA